MDLRLATVGLASTVVSYPSIEQTNFPSVQLLKANVDKNTQKHYLVVVFSGVNKRRLKNHFKNLQNKPNVVAIYICVKSKRNGIAGIDNSCLVTEQFLRYQLSQSIIEFFQKSINSLHNDQAFLGIQMKIMIDEIKRQRQSMIAPFNPCDVLIIPMNVGDDILHAYFNEIIDLCNDLFPDREPVVHLLDNYVSLYQKFNHDEHFDVLCEYVKKMGPIRLYLFGNEQKFHRIGKSLYENDNFSELPCDQYCARVEYEPVTDSTRFHALKNYTELQQTNGFRFERIRQIKNDTSFWTAVGYAQVSRDNRQLAATNQLSQHAINPIQFSSEHNLIAQPNVSSNDLTDVEINTSIQCSITDPQS